MKAFIRRSDRANLYKSIDHIHDPSIYDIQPGESQLIPVNSLQSPYIKEPLPATVLVANDNITPAFFRFKPPFMRNDELHQLKSKRQLSFDEIRDDIKNNHASIVHRTDVHNRKSSAKTVDEEREFRVKPLSAQIRAWRKCLPSILACFHKMPDPRDIHRIIHKLPALMVFGLFSFVLGMSSRRQMNRELTQPMIKEQLNRIIPEFDSIPHADALARVLNKTNPWHLEMCAVQLLRDLIRSKQLNHLLIEGAIPLTIDGTQKLYRANNLQDGRWCERKVGVDKDGNEHIQQYVYVLEANITLHNGLTIPLASEFLYRENAQMENSEDKQDNELTGFERLVERIKNYFPRQQFILLTDAMFAAESVIATCQQYRWKYMIRTTKDKHQNLIKALHNNKDNRFTIRNQPYYRKRYQQFYWQNYVEYGSLKKDIHLICCLEQYQTVSTKTGEVEKHYVDRVWIGSDAFHLDNLHTLCNLGARSKELIEDSINTEKNRGYSYKHAFSYDWQGMQCFHYLMRLAHALNAISAFSKGLKQFIKEHGVQSTIQLIKSTLAAPWLDDKWYKAEMAKPIYFQLE